MTELILRIFRFMKRHKTFRLSSLVVSSLVLVFFGAQMQYNEDISSLLPSTGGNEKMAFSSLRVKDKIFVLFSGVDGAAIDPDTLVEASDVFVANILASDSASGYISDVLYQLEEEILMEAVGYLCENFPIFVDSTAYATIDTLLTQGNIDRVMAETYATLTSAEGIAMKDMLQTDPIGLRSIIFETFNEIRSGMGNNQTMYDSHFFTPDTSVAIAYISPSFKSFDSKSGTELFNLIEKEIKNLSELYPDVEVQFHGAPVQSVYNSRQIKEDLLLTVAASLIVVCLFITICFKNKSTLPSLLLPVVYGAFFGLTLMYFIRGTMSLLALGIGAIVLGVALSYCLHVITHYKYVSTPEQVLRDQAKPVFLGCLTTIGSFLGLLFTQSELLQDFGLFASFSLVGTTFFSLIYLPHFFNPERNRRSKKAFGALERFNSHPFEKHKWLIACIIILCCVCLYTKNFVSFDANLKNIGYFDPKITKSMQTLTERTQPGLETKYYAAADSSFAKAIGLSRKMTATLDSLKLAGKLQGYSKTSMLFMTDEEQQANIDRWQAYWTPERKARAQQMISKAAASYGIAPEFFAPFGEMIDAEYEPQSLIDAEVIPEGLLANMVEHTDDTYMIFTPVQLRTEELNTVGRAVANINGCVVIDPMFYTSEMVQTINDDFNIALEISMAFVFVVLLISFRSLILAVLAFLPMTLSWYIVLGVMGIFGLQFNLINIVISTFIFGIGVDYSIFVMEGLLSKARSKSKPKLLVYHKTAIFLSAVILIITTGSLLLATHPALASIGIATIIGMSSAVVLSYTLQPFLYHALVKFMMKKKIKAKWLY